MRKFYFATALLGAMALMFSCQKGENDLGTDNGDTHHMTVVADSPETKTIVENNKGKFSSKWLAGDRIQLLEAVYENFEDKGASGEPVSYYISDPLTSDCTKATFSITTAAHSKPAGAKYKYVGVYPSDALMGVNWTGDNHTEWVEKWGVEKDDHMTLMLSISNWQRPTAEGFDPNADVLVSQLVESETQPTELTLNYARIGTVVCITLKNLPAGEQITEGTFSFGPNWKAVYVAEYDPELQQRGIFDKCPDFIGIQPQEVYVSKEGEASIWLRTFSGTLNDWFKMSVTTSNGKEEHLYEKTVNLAEKKTEIPFAEGGVTTFGIVMEQEYRVKASYISTSNITENSAELNFQYDLDNAPYTVATYGVLISTNSDHVESIESAAAGEHHILDTPDASGEVSLDLSGLSSGTQYFVRPYVTLDGKTYYGYNGMSFSTRAQLSYAIPELVDMGFPSGTKWASFNLGANSLNGAGYFYAFGETYPAENFYTINKYLYYGRANKYSTSALRGDTVDLKTVLDPEDDAATVNLGAAWRTPTYSDFMELLDNCDYSYDYDNKLGRFTSRINGNYIEIPNIGHRRYSKESANYLMSSNIMGYPSNPGSYPTMFNGIYVLYVDSYTNAQGLDDVSRSYGYNIRPVSGGSRQEIALTAHVDESYSCSANTITITPSFSNEERAGWTYTYTAFLYKAGETDSAWKRLTMDSRFAPFTFDGLESGTTYYYSVGWTGKGKDSGYTVTESGESEIRAATTL